MEATVQDRASIPTKKLFKYSEWVHVGGNPDEYEAIEKGNEPQDGGFHAYVRLPNQFQHRAIRDRALAAKARTRRQLRDPESDSYLILEDELSELQLDPDLTDRCVDELLAVDWWRHYQKAVEDIKHLEVYVEPTAEDEHPDPERPFEFIEEDQRRYQELVDLPEGDRPEDEFNSLVRHMEEYSQKVDDRLSELQDPRRLELQSLDTGTLLEKVRSQRIERATTVEFMHYYSTWQWIAGTFREPHGKPVFLDPKDFEEIDEDVIEVLRETFTRLENARGNS